MSAALELTSAVNCPASPIALIAFAISPLDSFGVPAVAVNTSTFAGLASAGVALSANNATSSVSARRMHRQIGGRAALRTSIRPSSVPLDPTPARRRYQRFDGRVN